MYATRKRANFTAFALISAIAISIAGAEMSGAKPAAEAGTGDTIPLTLDNLKNGSYQIPDSACGYKVIKLQNGKGSHQGIDVLFGRATFGKLSDKQEAGAAVHLAYKDEMFGWMQQVVFVVARGEKLLQVAELGLDEREQLRNIEFRDGDALIETTLPDDAAGKVYKKCTKAKLVETKEGCELTATEFNWYTSEGNPDGPSESPKRLVSLRD